QITDTPDTTTLSLTAGAATSAEGTSITYTATLTNPAQTPVTVTLSDGSTITIKAGESSGSVVVPAPANDVYNTNTTVSTTITGATGGNFENLATNPTPAVVQITDTIDTTVASITGSTQVTEGEAATYTVSLSNPAQTEVTVNLTYSGTAADGSDYTQVVSVKIPAGASSTTFDLATINDKIPEGVENVTVSLGAITGGNFENVVVSGTNGSVTTTIIDNDALPVVDLNGSGNGVNSETTFTEGTKAGVPIAADINVSDVDSPNLQGAKVTLTNAQDADSLVVGSPNANITVTTATVNGQIVLTLTGTATAAEYEAVIKSITFHNDSNDPSVVDRNITVTVNDGQNDSVAVASTVHVVAVNDAPTVTFENPTYVENGDAQSLVNNLQIKDVDGDTLSGAKITLTGIQAEDLIVSQYYKGGNDGTTDLGIRYTLSNGPNGSIVITLSGNASVADYTTLINSITYANSSDNPSAAPRGVTIEVTDVDAHGTDNQSGSHTGEIDITPVNDAPTVTAASGSGNEDGMIKVVLGGADVDGTIDHFNLVDMAAHGTFYADADGKVELTSASDIAAANNSATIYFKPEKDWSGNTDFSYTAVDNQNLAAAAPATGTITVAPVTDMPDLELVGDKTVVSLNVNGQTTGSIGDITGGVWHTDNSGDVVEISQPGTYGVAGNAQNTAVIELERNAGDPSNLYTNIDAKAGATYTISVDYSVRAGAESNSLINVYWGGALVGTLNNSVTGIKTYTFDVPVTTDGNARLEFKAGDSNSLGGVINNISVTEHLNTGLEDNAILLSTIKANTTDIDGSETLSLNLKGLPAGSTLSDGVHTFSATAGNTSTDITNWNLSTLKFTPPSNLSGDIKLTVTATAQDGAAAPVSKDLSFDVHVIAVADAPIVTTSAAQGAEDSPIQVNIGTALVDTDGSESLSLLTVSNIPLGAVLTDGVNSYTSIKTGDGAVIIDGWDLSKLTITPPKDFNGQFTLQVSVTSTETTGQSATTTKPLTVTVTPVNDAPVLDLNTADGADQTGYALTYVENGKPLSIAGNVSITDVDNTTLKGATVTLTNAQAGDVLAVSNQFGIKAAVSGIVNGKITITLSGEASTASYEKVIQSITYKNTSDNPSTADRTLTVQVNDGQSENNLSNVATTTISVTAVNDAPVVDLNGPFFPGNNTVTLPYVENAAPVKLMPLLTLSDPDSPNLQSATVTVKDAQAGDKLVFDTSNSKITITSETVNGQLVYTLKGAASQAEYAAVLKSVAFVSEGEDPVGGNRAITVQVNDGQDSSNVATANIVVIPVNDAPVITAPTQQTVAEDTPLTFSAANGNAITVKDVDASPTDVLKITITATGGTLLLTGGATSDAQGNLTLTGTQAQINAALDGATFTPAQDSNNTTGTAGLSIVIDDRGNSGVGGAKSDTQTISIDVTPVDDAPVIHAPTTTQVIAEDTALTFSSANGNAITVTDVDAGSSQLRIYVNVTGGTLVLANGDSSAAHNGAVSLTGTLQEINAALEGAKFTPTQDSNNTTGTAGLSISVNDLGNTGALPTGSTGLTDSTTIKIDVTPVNDAPVARDDIGAPVVGTLQGNYYGYKQGIDGGNLGTIKQALDFIASHKADATFDAKTLNYGGGGAFNNNLGQSGNLGSFLGGDKGSLTYTNGSNTQTTTSDAIVELAGKVSMAAGTYSLKVTADDGYLVLIDGKQVLAVDKNQSAASKTGSFSVTGDGPHDIQIVYWDQGGSAQLKVEVAAVNANGSVGPYSVLGTSNAIALGHDTLTTLEDQPLVIKAATLLANDSDVDGDKLTIDTLQGKSTLTTPADVFDSANHKVGTVVMDANGNVVFTPAKDVNGLVTFSYTVTDGQANSNTATVTVNVTSVNDAPVAAVTTGKGVEDTTSTGQLQASDVDQGDILTYTVKDADKPAGFSVDASGQWTLDAGNAAYQHLGAGQTATFTVPFTVTDKAGLSSTSNLILTVTGTNDAPVAAVSTGTAVEDAKATGQLQASDIDDNDVLTYTVNDADKPAGFNVEASGKWTLDASDPAYQHLAAGETTTLTVPFTVTDKAGLTSTSNLTITVTGTNDAPVANVSQGTGVEDTTTTGQLLASDADNGDVLTYTVNDADKPAGFSVDASGKWTLDASNPAYQHLAEGETTTLTVPFTVTDKAGLNSTSNLTITVTGTNDAPVAQAATASAVEAQHITSGINNGAAVDGSALVATFTTTSANQTVSFDWNFTAKDYSPFNDFAFVQVNGQQVAVLSNVSAVGNYGTSGTHTYSYTFSTPGTYQIVVGVANVSDSQNDSVLTVGNLTGVTPDTLVANGSAVENKGTWTLTAEGATAQQISDLINKPLLVTGQLVATDVDDGSHLTYGLKTGTAAVDGFNLKSDGSWTFDSSNPAYDSLAAGEIKTITIPYTATDEHGATGDSTLTITVTGTNDAPVATVSTGTAVEDAKATGQLQASDVDNGDVLTYTVKDTDKPAGFSVDASGKWTLDASNPAYQHLAAGQTTTLDVPFTVTDKAGLTSTSTLTITVTGTNDAPVAAVSTGTAVEDSKATGQLQASDIDDNDVLTYTVNDADKPAGFTVDASGKWTLDAGNPAYQHLGAGQTTTL
ncbi:VCBS repeat-containing protein, partial [Pseudomonas sp. NFACC02]|uniref:tandem-95 repeat protein n=1 Tax=Pseudomonas sp. NFACC02 TaxID=1566250 RepID=UPI0008C52A2E